MTVPGWIGREEIFTILIFIFSPFASSLSLRHEYGGSIDLVANGQTLDPSMSNVKLRGKSGSVRLRLPDLFFDGIIGETTFQALGIMVLDKLDNTTVAGSSNSAGNNERDKPPTQRHLQADEEPAEVGKLNALGENLLFGFILSLCKNKYQYI